jgi:hypothetical protein
MKEILSLEDSNIRNQHKSSITDIYPDFKLNPPSYIIVNFALKYSSNYLKFYLENIRDLKRKINQAPNVSLSELPRLLCITEHHLRDLEIDMMSTEYYRLGTRFCRHQYGGV